MIVRRFVVATAAFAVVAPALLPSAAFANPVSRSVPFTTVQKSAFGGAAQAQQVVISDEAAYKAFFGGRPPVAVDFSKDVVLAVSMGTQRSGGYGIEITNITQMIQGITGGMTFVSYQEHSPAPGTMVPWVITQPVHVVKVSKLATRWVFTKAAAAASYDSLRLELKNTSVVYDRIVTLKPDGTAHFESKSVTGGSQSVDGTATAAELKAVNDAFAKADVATLPSMVPDPRLIAGGSRVSLDSTIGAKTYGFSASLDFYGGYKARVKPLVDALTAISHRLAGNPAAPFDRLVLTTENSWTRQIRTIFVVAKGGEQIETRRQPNRAIISNTGKCTAAELRDLIAAFSGADVPTLPKTLPGIVMDGTTIRLESHVGQHTYVESGFYGAYGSYKARVKPLVDALLKIETRVLGNGNTGGITGGVPGSP